MLSSYDTSAIPDSLYYLMVEAQIKKGGAASLVPFALETVQRESANLLVFEGIENVLNQVRSSVDFLEMITRLRTLARLQNCTTILTIKQLHPNPALTIVDSIIELTDTITGPRSVRMYSGTEQSAKLPWTSSKNAWSTHPTVSAGTTAARSHHCVSLTVTLPQSSACATSTSMGGDGSPPTT